MLILNKQTTVEELMCIENEKFFEDMVKAVVDIDKQVLAVNAELHADLESYLREQGSEEKYLYGINIYDDGEKVEQWQAKK